MTERLVGTGMQSPIEANYASRLLQYRDLTGPENSGQVTSNTDYFDALPSFIIPGTRIGWHKLYVCVAFDGDLSFDPTSFPAASFQDYTAGFGSLGLFRNITDVVLQDETVQTAVPNFTTAHLITNVHVPSKWSLQLAWNYSPAEPVAWFDRILPGEYKILALNDIPRDVQRMAILVQHTE